MDNEYNQTSGEVCEPSNETAWNTLAYEAWIAKYGYPQAVADKIRIKPRRYLTSLLDHFGEVKGRKIANLMGSHGIKAVALALLGAQVTVFDFSSGNQKFAEELAKYAKADIRYILGNIITLPEEELSGDYDIAFAEMGIIHYFTDLVPLFQTARSLLKPGAIFILRDFHPVTTKLITSRGTTAKIRKHKVDGDYFDTSLIESEIAYGKYLPDGDTQKVLLRKWNLGEIITAVARSGFMIESLTEEPNQSSEGFDKGIPKTFTLVARK